MGSEQNRSPQPERIFKYMSSLEVEDFKDVKSGYSISFTRYGQAHSRGQLYQRVQLLDFPRYNGLHLIVVCDGMTYKEIKKNMHVEYEARKKDKLRYRYPRGESYLDVIQG